MRLDLALQLLECRLAKEALLIYPPNLFDSSGYLGPRRRPLLDATVLDHVSRY
jgi:hypothetical protein